ncbi:INP1 [Candida metapsilosis]|uniref:Inheritance of peroxisomes protein 1 n=1 Tax=Candida metapsilosis TaxID=273372 RepID=A0A8H8DAP0_9ASCO|nr:INP1 [Candida metapsilosis]
MLSNFSARENKDGQNITRGNIENTNTTSNNNQQPALSDPKPNSAAAKKKTRKKNRLKNKSQSAPKHDTPQSKQLQPTSSAHNSSSHLATENGENQVRSKVDKFEGGSMHVSTKRDISNKSTSVKSTKAESSQQKQPQQHTTQKSTPVLPSPLSFQTSAPPQPSYKSPRKEMLIRQKRKNSVKKENKIDLRENLKPTEEPSPSTSPASQSGDLQTVTLMMEDKVTLFKYKSSNIIELPHKDDTTGSLLAHGELEIFQLLNGGITCLSCGGKSFIYPLLPKIKIFRIGYNQFLIPMLNPERYWRITIDSDESNVLSILEGTLERNVNYIHVSDKPSNEQHDQGSSSHSQITLDPRARSTSANSLDAKPEELMATSPKPEEFPAIIDTEIPESPPSAPISPTHSPVQHFEISPKDSSNYTTSLAKKTSQQSMSTNVACLDWKPNNTQQNTQLKVRRSLHINPYRSSIQSERDITRQSSSPYLQTNIEHLQPPIKTVDEQSEASMDLLLDEFDQNIAKSVRNPSVRSRPLSRHQSVTSHHNPVPTYSRGKYFHGNIDRDDEDDDVIDEEVYEDARDHRVPPNTPQGAGAAAAAASIHDRGLHSARSRKSSRSDLYTNESGWMEPNLDQSAFQKSTMHSANSPNVSSRLPRSRSSYSISSSTSNANNLGNIYRSVIGTKQRRDSYYSQYQAQPSPYISSSQSVRNGYYDGNIDSRSMAKSVSLMNSQVNRQSGISRRRLSTNSGFNTTQSMNGSAKYSHNGARHVKLNSSEIYQLLSTKEEPVMANEAAKPLSRSASFTSRIFGW